MPFYVSPEQQMKDKADYARKGIARGRNSVVIRYDDGILFVAPNPSGALHKISEIYDRIAFAAVGRYNEYENLRVAGVRYADTRGYQYDRADVTARGLANWYAQVLGTIFTESNKPYEVEIVVAELGESAAGDQMYRITFDGSVADEHGYVAMGGQADQVAARAQGAVHRGHVAVRRAGGRARRAGRPGQRGTVRGQLQPAGGRGAHARPGAPGIPAAHRPPARGAAVRGRQPRPAARARRPPRRSRVRRAPAVRERAREPPRRRLLRN